MRCNAVFGSRRSKSAIGGDLIPIADGKDSKNLGSQSDGKDGKERKTWFRQTSKWISRTLRRLSSKQGASLRDVFSPFFSLLFCLTLFLCFSIYLFLSLPSPFNPSKSLPALPPLSLPLSVSRIPHGWRLDHDASRHSSQRKTGSGFRSPAPTARRKENGGSAAVVAGTTHTSRRLSVSSSSVPANRASPRYTNS